MTNCSGRCCELGSLVPPIFYMIDEIVSLTCYLPSPIMLPGLI